MSALVWRRLLLALCCVSLFTISYGRWNGTRFGITGVTLPESLVGKIAVDPNSPAAKAGLRTGDLVDLRALSNAERYRWNEPAILGEVLQIPVRRGGRLAVVRITAAPPVPMPLIFWLAYVGFLWLVLFAGLIAWRRPDNAEARVLALFLILFPGTFPLWDEWYSPSVHLDLVANAIGAFQFISYALLATYAMLFPLRSIVRSTLAYAAYAIACAGTVGLLMREAGFWFGLPALMAPTAVELPVQPLVCLASLLCVLVTLLGLKGPQRSRVAWVAAFVGPMYFLEFIVWGPAAFGYLNATLRDVLDFSICLAPVGLWCSLLTRRVFDIGFAINRAAVFTGVSLVVVGIFVLVEWAFGEWFSSASHTTNLAISAALALALGLSVRAIHSRVDRVLDTVFFRKRHEDEQAIRMLAREAAYISDPDVLLARVVKTLEEHADASTARILLENGGCYVGSDGGRSISENDPAIVRLRTTRTPLDLRDVTTATQGEFAYPMLARGRLVGILVLGLKRSGESYAPDESDAVAQLAHDAGAALDVLEMKKDPQGETPLGGALERLQASCNALAGEIRELRTELREVQSMRHA